MPTAKKLYDSLDRARAFDAFVNTFQGVNARAIHRGFLDIGVKDNEILIFSELMDAKSLFLTAKCRHGLFRRRDRPVERADDPGDTARGARHHRRLLVAVGDRFRRARRREFQFPVPIAAPFFPNIFSSLMLL